MSFRLVPKLVTLNDLERRNGVILRYLIEFGYLPVALSKSARSLSHLLMSSYSYSKPLSNLVINDDDDEANCWQVYLETNITF